MDPARTREREPTVLVVDDDLTACVLAEESLAEAGFEIVIARSGDEAVQQFREHDPDIVLLDVLMPGKDGFETCAEMRQLPGAGSVPILLVTGLDDMESINKAYDVGATDFANKPFNGPLLAHRLRYILRASGALTDLQKSESDLARAQRIAKIGSWEWRLDHDSFRGSREFYRILGTTEEDFGGTLASFLEHVHAEDRSALSRPLDPDWISSAPVEVQHRLLRRDGSELTVRTQVEIMNDGRSEERTVTGTIQDISELKRVEREVHFLAYHDALTGLPNRTLFLDRVSQALSYARRKNEKLAAMFLDLDRFKRINDTLGHSVGDELLKAVADRLLSCMREEDSVGGAKERDVSCARLGGDEFTIVVAQLHGVSDAAKVARRVLDALSDPFKLGHHEVFVTGSLGIALYPEDGDDVDVLLRHADVAMYHAKENGRNNFEFFSASMNETALERLSLENAIRAALERDEFALVYQPKVDIRTREMVGAEALLRWRHPEMGLVSPASFIQVAEDAGISQDIDRWVIRAALMQLRAWEEDGLPQIRVAVNISNRLFNHKDFMKTIVESLRETGVDPKCLELELTEGIMMDKVTSAVARLEALKDIGLRLSIDDFGTGYSSLSYLRKLPIDVLKIDRSFIGEVTSNEEDTAIVRAIIAVGHNLGLTVLAEGVEHAEQLEFLERNGCDQVQGFYTGRPVPPEELWQVECAMATV